ncbi:MAG: hypothetical protein Q9191_007232 [Dirinaria sp. TL-2023a]
MPPIPSSFAKKKATVLAALATPEESYSDLSPKGSIDTRIKGLIDRINRIEGAVTTSSCAGRISVFLEGRKAKGKHSNSIAEEEGGEHKGPVPDDNTENKSGENSVPGGKGLGGRWLFVSHDPVKIPIAQQPHDSPISKLFGLASNHRNTASLPDSEARFVKFQFEPMILHIMTASLRHAQPILAAAINAGFRESGVQSLKNLDDPNAFPMIAVRTTGLATSSLVGYVEELQGGVENIYSLVSEEYLQMMLKTANARFLANEERIRRLDSNLFSDKRDQQAAWEDPQLRKERKRAKGLTERQHLPDPSGQAGNSGQRDLDSEELGIETAFYQSDNGAAEE